MRNHSSRLNALSDARPPRRLLHNSTTELESRHGHPQHRARQARVPIVGHVEAPVLVPRFATFPLFGLLAGVALGVREVWAWAPGEFPTLLVIAFMPFTVFAGLWTATLLWALVELAMTARYRAPRGAPVAAILVGSALGAGFALIADAAYPNPMMRASLVGLAVAGSIIVTLAIRGRPTSLAPPGPVPDTGTLVPDRRL